MKKRIATLLFGLVCVAAIVSLMICSAQVDYAKEHYENNYGRDPKQIFESLANGYGCGENDCTYCNGGQYKRSMDDFVYLNSMNKGKTVSTVVAVVSGIATLAFGIWAFQPKKSDIENAEQ